MKEKKSWRCRAECLQGNKEDRGSRVKVEGTETDTFMAILQLNGGMTGMTDNSNLKKKKKCRCTYYSLSDIYSCKNSKILIK
jgi:ribosomal protein S1